MRCITRLDKSGYRDDIDGLRAVAVCAVVLGHLFPTSFHNGYLGVDVFFVISGFVITQLMFNLEKHSLSQFLIEFYAKRFRRLLPALIVVVIVTFLLIFMLVAQVSEGILTTGALSIVGFSNMYLYHLSTDYFGPDALENYFTHMWSLGVEEQFYLVYPILFFTILKLTKLRFRKSILFSAILGTAISIIINIAASASNPNLVFYSMPTRLWEMGVGAILYLIGDIKYRPNWRYKRLQLIAFLLLIIAFILPTNLGFTGNLGVVVLTGFLLFFGRNESSLKLIKNKNSLWIGKHSYSIYLVHWPLLIFANYLYGTGEIKNFLLLPLILILSSGLFKFIENPFRIGRFKATAKRTLNLGIPVVLVITVTILGRVQPFIVAQGGLVPRSIGLQAMPEWIPAPCSGARNIRKLVNPITYCLGGVRTGSNSFVYLIGDSHADQFIPMLQETFRNSKYEVKNLNMENGSDFPYGDFLANTKSASLKYLETKAQKGDIIVLTFHRGRLNEQRDTHIPIVKSIRVTPQTKHLIGNLDNFAKLMAEKAVKVILVKDSPLMNSVQSSQSCAVQLKLFGRNNCRVSKTQDSHTRYLQSLAFDKVKSVNPNVLTWDPFEYIYRNSDFFDVLGMDGMYSMRDWNHISENLSRQLSLDFSVSIRSYIGIYKSIDSQ